MYIIKKKPLLKALIKLLYTKATDQSSVDKSLIKNSSWSVVYIF